MLSVALLKENLFNVIKFKLWVKHAQLSNNTLVLLWSGSTSLELFWGRFTSSNFDEVRRTLSKFRQTSFNCAEVSSPIPTFDINLDHAHSYKHTFLKKQKLDNAQSYKPTLFVKKPISIKLKEIIMLRNSLYVLPRAEVHVLTSVNSWT